MKKLTCTFLLIFCGLVLLRAQEISKTFEGVTKVELNVASGNILVKHGSGAGVHVNLEHTYGDGFRPVMKQQGSTLILKEEFDRGSHSGRSTWTLTIPDDLDIRSNSGSGNFEASGLTMALEMNSGSGNVDLNGVKGEIRLNTGSGNMDVRSFDGSLRSNTGSGNIRIEGSRGEIRLNAGSGSLALRGVNAELQANVGSGDIDAENITLTGAGSFNSGSGDVDVRLAQSPAYDISLNSGSGDAALHLGGHQIDGTVVMTANKRNGKIVAPFAFDSTEEIDDGHNTRVKKTAKFGSKDIEVKIGTGSGTASIRE